MKRLLYIILALVALVASLGARAAKGSPGPSREDRDKADYLYLEALRSRAKGENDAAFSLMQRAAELNPDDKEIGYELARYLLVLMPEGSAETPLRLMREYVDANPADYQAGSQYAMINDRLQQDAEALRVLLRLHAAYPERPELTWATARALGHTGDTADLHRAIVLFDSLEVSQGPSVQIAGQRLELYYQLGDTAAIFNDADRLLALRPTDPDFQIYSGNVYGQFGGDSAKVLSFYDRAIELDPSSGWAYFSKAAYYRSQGDSVAYTREMTNAMTRENLDVETKLGFIQEYVKSNLHTGDSLAPARIREMFDTLTLLHPLDYNVRELYTSFLTMEKDWPAAAEQLEQTLGLEPANEDGWDFLSGLYFQTDDTIRAADAVRRGLRYYPESVKLLLKLGVINNMNRDYAGAEETYRRALAATSPKDIETISQIYTSLGDAFQGRQMSDSAFAAYDKALEYNPDNSFALNNAAYHMACEERDLDRALTMAEKACRLSVDNPTNLDTYAWVLYKLGRYAEAREQIDRAIELAAEDPSELGSEIYDHAGDIYEKLGEHDKAREWWQKALEFDPDDAPAIREKIKQRR